jgi:hypothetical protein
MDAETANRASRNVHAAMFGITLPEAALLLAANRLVRIFGYSWVADFYAHRGPRAACLLAAGSAALSNSVMRSCPASGRFLWSGCSGACRAPQ